MTSAVLILHWRLQLICMRVLNGTPEKMSEATTYLQASGFVRTFNMEFFVRYVGNV